MSASEFDELIRHKFDDYEVAYNPANWERMSEELGKKQQSRKKGFIAIWPVIAGITGIAATIALLVALPALWKHDTQNTAPIASNAKQAEKSVPAVTETKTTEPANNSLDKIASTPAPPARHVKSGLVTSGLVHPVSSEKREILPNSTDVASTPEKTAPNTSQKQLPDRVLQNLAGYTTDDIAVASKEKRTSINLVGGFNYNSASAGYMIGASANRNLNDKLYIEGNLAFVNSSFGGNASSGSFNDQFDAAPPNNVSGSQSKTSSQPAQYNLNYLQFSPVLGYHISPRFTIGAGPDLQQLLNDHNSIDLQVPALDMGILGKAEYGITEKLKAGLQYRAGLNNALQGTVKYMERNYMQVQIRYSIFNK